MISVDTNIIVRLLTKDDPVQFDRAKALFEKEQILIATTVLLESEWVLRYAYKFPPIRIADAFESLFGLSNVTLQEPNIISDALGWHRQGLDFADAIHLAKSQEQESFVTFDKKLIRTASQITGFPVKGP